MKKKISNSSPGSFVARLLLITADAKKKKSLSAVLPVHKTSRTRMWQEEKEPIGYETYVQSAHVDAFY